MFALAWSRLAFDQMGQIIRDAPERKADFQRILYTLTQTLCTDPLAAGESREGTRRIWFVEDLVVTFNVDEDGLDVLLLSVALASNA